MEVMMMYTRHVDALLDYGPFLCLRHEYYFCSRPVAVCTTVNGERVSISITFHKPPRLLSRLFPGLIGRPSYISEIRSYK